jgi:uncharacterized protein YndB with AHSA1/START domain
MPAAGRKADSPHGALTPAAANEIVIVRELAAPREAVFDAWASAEHLARWWGPTDWTTPECTTDPRPGGRWRLVMRSPGGDEQHAIGGEYREVTRPSRLVFTNGFLHEPRPVQDFVCVVALDELGARRTRLTLTVQCVSEEERVRMSGFGAEVGWGQSLDRLASLVAGEG